MDRSQRFSKLYIPAVLDMLEELGYRDEVVLPRSLRPTQPDVVIAGPAFPFTFAASTNRDKDAVYSDILRAYETAPTGSILVAAAAPGGPEAALFGELSATTCQSRGLAGAIIQGGCRDVPYIRSLGFPVFCEYFTPKDVLGRYEVSAVGEPVEIGGVRIRPGDYVVADFDGVVVVPLEKVDELLDGAEKIASDEAEMRSRLMRGEMPSDVYQDFGRF